MDQIKNPHINAKEQRDLIDALLQQLQSEIDDLNAKKTQEVDEMRDMLATYEQNLALMKR